jgi:hypothetical protein
MFAYHGPDLTVHQYATSNIKLGELCINAAQRYENPLCAAEMVKERFLFQAE